MYFRAVVVLHIFLFAETQMDMHTHTHIYTGRFGISFVCSSRIVLESYILHELTFSFCIILERSVDWLSSLDEMRFARLGRDIISLSPPYVHPKWKENATDAHTKRGL